MAVLGTSNAISDAVGRTVIKLALDLVILGVVACLVCLKLHLPDGVHSYFQQVLYLLGPFVPLKSIYLTWSYALHTEPRPGLTSERESRPYDPPEPKEGVKCTYDLSQLNKVVTIKGGRITRYKKEVKCLLACSNEEHTSSQKRCYRWIDVEIFREGYKSKSWWGKEPGFWSSSNARELIGQKTYTWYAYADVYTRAGL